MDFSSVDYLAVMTASAMAFMLCVIWYGIFQRPWRQAAGLGSDARPPFYAYIIVTSSYLIATFILAAVMSQLSIAGAAHGALLGATMWLGFSLITIAPNYTFQHRPVALILIDAGQWLCGLTLAGMVLGLFQSHSP